jgi:two-component SAPR family response regulator
MGLLKSSKIVFRPLILSVCLLLLLLLTLLNGYCQSFGLGFNGNDFVQDKRTGLNLFPDKAYATGKGVVELRFDLSFEPGHFDYFGNVVRIVLNNSQNIDLLYDKNPAMQEQFRFIIGDAVSPIPVKIDTSRLFSAWTALRIVMDISKGKFLCYRDQQLVVSMDLALKQTDSMRLFFGAHHYGNFYSTDVPAMVIRDINVQKNDHTEYHFPLDERTGNLVHTADRKATGQVENPVWIRNNHYAWRTARSFSLKGAASVAFDSAADRLYIFGADSIITWFPGRQAAKAAAYSTGRQPFLPGNQSVYAGFNNTSYNFYIDHRLAGAFNTAVNSWDVQYKPGYPTSFWHFNKFVAQHDTAVYMIGGYGHHTYLNSIYRYGINTKKWDSLRTQGETLMPRYLFALGATPAGDTAYILGGYGNASGRQIEHPHNIYDLLLFDVKKRTWKKVYELPAPEKDFAFASSMVLDPQGKHYYALIFPNYKFDSKLRLIRGSLTKPEYELLGDEIPYPFLDIASYADLYYSPKSKAFIAVTMHHDSADITHTRVYTLAAPPVNADEPVAVSPVGEAEGKVYGWMVAAVLLLVGAGIYYYIRKRRAAPVSTLEKAPVAANGGEEAIPVASVPRRQRESTRNAVYFFGELQLFDKEGIDITRQLTPIVKELFLIVYLYSTENGRGVSAEKTMEILWPDRPEQSARNNRSVNMAKLKALLDKSGPIQLLKDGEYTRIDIDANLCYVDYAEYLSIVSDRKALTREKVERLSAIVSKGGFLSNLERDWLDPFKSAVSNNIIDTYLDFAARLNYEEHAEFLQQLAGNIFYFDALNEHGLSIQCKALTQLGKHSLAIKVYEKFARDYKTSYGEDYSKTLPQVIGSAAV